MTHIFEGRFCFLIAIIIAFFDTKSSLVEISENLIYYYANKYIADLKLSDYFSDYVTRIDECLAVLTIGKIEQRSGLGLFPSKTYNDQVRPIKGCH
ncbi:hypothetical protein N8742_05655 [Emcibacteraceae bacterium]|nr:hypothetical protein [Emcibacteraceae bacterium]